MDATENGAKMFTYCEVKSLIREGGKVIGVDVYDHKNRVNRKFFAPLVVNAGGIWGQGIAEYADLKIKMFPAKGALLVMGHRINKMVINRCRKPADADILVPGDTICVIGTTSSRIPYDQIDNMEVTPEEVDILFREGEKLAPSLRHTRVLRAYAGVRPLVASDDDPSGRNVSRGIVLLDHAERDGLDGFITITGGKLMNGQRILFVKNSTKPHVVQLLSVHYRVQLKAAQKPIRKSFHFQVRFVIQPCIVMVLAPLVY